MPVVNKSTLQVCAQLVYGDPCIAKIKNGRMELLSKSSPVRNLQDEQRLCSKYQSYFNFSVEQEPVFKGEQAVAIIKKIKDWQTGKDYVELANFTCDVDLKPNVQIKETANGFRLDVKFDVEGNKTKKGSTHKVLTAWKNGSSMVPLIDKGWGGYLQLA